MAAGNGATGACGGGGGALVLRQLGAGWLECLDEQGTFYCHSATKQVLTELPEELGGRSARAPAPWEASPPTMPVMQVMTMRFGDWVVAEGALGERYYYAPSGQSVDEPPPQLVELYKKHRALEEREQQELRRRARLQRDWERRRQEREGMEQQLQLQQQLGHELHRVGQHLHQQMEPQHQHQQMEPQLQQQQPQPQQLQQQAQPPQQNRRQHQRRSQQQQPQPPFFQPQPSMQLQQQQQGQLPEQHHPQGQQQQLQLQEQLRQQVQWHMMVQQLDALQQQLLACQAQAPQPLALAPQQVAQQGAQWGGPTVVDVAAYPPGHPRAAPLLSLVPDFAGSPPVPEFMTVPPVPLFASVLVQDFGAASDLPPYNQGPVPLSAREDAPYEPMDRHPAAV